MPKYQLSEKVLAASLAMLAFVMWVVGVVWHGLLGHPSLLPYIYPWFSYSNPIHAAALLVMWAVSFYVIGYLVALFYNRNLKKK